MANNTKINESIDHLLSHCGSLSSHEKVVIVCDVLTTEIGQFFYDRAVGITNYASLKTIPVAKNHGEEPPDDVALLMNNADLVLGLTSMSMAHTNARMNLTNNGGRYLSLPEYSLELLQDPSVMVDYKAVESDVRYIADAFTSSHKIRVTTEKGTDIYLDSSGRIGNCCPGFVSAAGDLGSPPDIEANISPLETKSNGIVIVDGSIPCPEIGLLYSPVILTVEEGKIVKFDGKDKEVISRLEKLFSDVNSDKAYVLAECGVGLNREAKLTGSMLTDEGAWGCMHFGFGANSTVGGLNSVPFHLDFVFQDACLEIDGKTILKDGDIIR